MEADRDIATLFSSYRTAYDLPPLPLSEFIAAVGTLPKQKEIIEGILPEQQVMLIAGDPWQGKSLEHQMLACAFGAGGKYHGLQLSKCRAVYFTWEGAGDKIVNRFSHIARQFDIDPDYEPTVKLLPNKQAINTDEGQDYFTREIERAQATVALFDSFPYTVNGNYSRDDSIINVWWEGLQNIIHRTGVTPIFVWEFSKMILDAKGPQNQYQFDLQRLKSGYTVAYKVNTVVMIGEVKGTKRVIADDGTSVPQWRSFGHRIVIPKAKDANQPGPLTVTLDPNTLLWTGQHWELDKTTGEIEVRDD